MIRLSTVLTILAFINPLTLVCGAPVAARPRKQARYIMGTVCEITAYPPPGKNVTEKEDRFDEAINAAFDELKRIDALLSNWKPGSELMRMNAAAAAPGAVRPWVKAAPELYARLQVALAIAERTGGRFDPTVGPLVRAWGFLPAVSKADAHTPAAALRRIRDARARVGWNKVKLKPQESAVQFAVAGMEIDLGGIAKGYAAARAAEVLRQHGISRALVSLGSSSITAVGEPEPCESAANCGWSILVRDPRDGETPVATLYLRGGESLATSGTYEKSTGRGKHRKSHIINPRTGEAIGGAVSVTVVHRDAELADALTKPFFLMSPTSAGVAKLLRGYLDASVILIKEHGNKLAMTALGADPARFSLIGPADSDAGLPSKPKKPTCCKNVSMTSLPSRGMPSATRKTASISTSSASD